MSAGERSCGNDTLGRHGGIGQGNIVADGAIEQHVLLKHDPDLATEPSRIDSMR
jgi:hypothetical protein